MQVRLALASLMVCAACSPPPSSVEGGPVARSLTLAAQEAEVPPELLVAIAATEGGLRLAAHRVYDADDHVLVAGRLELRHGGYDSLARGAAILGTTEQVLVEDTELATRAGAAVLAELGARHGATSDLSSWIPALEELSGLSEAQQRSDYARRVLRKVRDGGSFTGYGGERIVLAPTPGLEVLGVAMQALGTAEFPGAIWFDTSCTNKCNVGRGTNTIDTIVIHDTEGGWDASIATLQNDSGKSVHYIIDADGSRTGQFRPESDITWHSGNSVYNGRSVGIEHVGYVDDPDGFSPGLYDTSAELVASIRSRHAAITLDRTHIIGHYQVPDGGQMPQASPPCADPLMSCLGSSKYGGANNHRDPGTHWMWCQYMEKLGGSCACADAFAHFNCTTDKTEAVRCNNGTVEIQHCASACVVQPIGVDDLCALEAPAPSHNPRIERPPGAIHDSPVPPIDPGETPTPAEAHGCAMAPRAPSSLAALLFFVAMATLLRRRSSR